MFSTNDRLVFYRLVLDQGYYPEGLYTAGEEQDFVKDIQASLDMGFNGARLHQKVFEPRFLYHCDKMGYLVWGEFASWGMDVSDPRCLEQVLSQWMEAVQRNFNHPSLAGAL